MGRRLASRRDLTSCSPYAASGLKTGGHAPEFGWGEKLDKSLKRRETRDHPKPTASRRPSTSCLTFSFRRKRRSRKRLAFSQEVSELNVQKWQAAPCRKSSPLTGVR